MDSSSTGLLIALVILVAFSAFFSASETAFTTANRIRLKSMEQEGKKKAGKVLTILEDYDSLLSTILIGNNIVNISASSISTVIFVRALGDIGATWSTVVLTVVILIFGEITPKSIAKEVPESFAMAVANPIWITTKIFFPLTKLFSLWKSLVKKVLHLNAEDKITEDEFMTMVDEAESDGGISEDDSELIKNVIDFNDMEVQEVL
ncbi:MAG TPA: CNNM domain-containing protein, partial [Clostridiales bacterium]|nr:CNNM domain-containing protein [Clostridiales bacterium]